MSECSTQMPDQLATKAFIPTRQPFDTNIRHTLPTLLLQSAWCDYTQKRTVAIRFEGSQVTQRQILEKEKKRVSNWPQKTREKKRERSYHLSFSKRRWIQLPYTQLRVHVTLIHPWVRLLGCRLFCIFSYNWNQKISKEKTKSALLHLYKFEQLERPWGRRLWCLLPWTSLKKLPRICRILEGESHGGQNQARTSPPPECGPLTGPLWPMYICLSNLLSAPGGSMLN